MEVQRERERERERRRGDRYSSSLSLNSALDTVVVNAKPLSLYSREGNQVPIV